MLFFGACTKMFWQPLQMTLLRMLICLPVRSAHAVWHLYRCFCAIHSSKNNQGVIQFIWWWVGNKLNSCFNWVVVNCDVLSTGHLTVSKKHFGSVASTVQVWYINMPTYKVLIHIFVSVVAFTVECNRSTFSCCIYRVSFALHYELTCSMRSAMTSHIWACNVQESQPMIIRFFPGAVAKIFSSSVLTV